MDFELTEKQGLLRESLRRLIAREYALERRQGILNSQGFSAAVWRLFAQQGLLAFGLPENVGGCGGPLEIMVLMEEFGRGLVLEPFVSTVVLGAGLICDHGTVAQRAKLLPKIITGDCRLALAHPETGANHVLDRVSTVARRGRGTYLLNGRKPMVFDAPVADMLIVSARDDSAGGLSLFLVTPDVPGMKVTKFRTIDGRTAADITLENVTVATSARLGCAGFALNALEQAADCALAALCAEAVGVMEVINQTCLHQLDKCKLSSRHVLDMLIVVAQAQSMSYLASRRCREPQRSERRRALAAAEAYVARAARFLAHKVVRLHTDMPEPTRRRISHYLRRLTMIRMGFGHGERRFGNTLTGLLRATRAS